MLVEARVEDVALVKYVLHGGGRRVTCSVVEGLCSVLREEESRLIGFDAILNAELVLVDVVHVASVGPASSDLFVRFDVQDMFRDSVDTIAGVHVVVGC